MRNSSFLAFPALGKKGGASDIKLKSADAPKKGLSVCSKWLFESRRREEKGEELSFDVRAQRKWGSDELVYSLMQTRRGERQNEATYGVR